MERLNLKDLPDLSIYTRISPQGQVTVPASIRKALSLSPGDILAWLLQVKETALPEIKVKPLPQSWASYTRGPGKKLFSRTLLTNDEVFRKIKEIKIFLLKDIPIKAPKNS